MSYDGNACADIKPVATETLQTGTTSSRPRTLRSARRCRMAWSDDSQPQPSYSSVHDKHLRPTSSSTTSTPSVIPILITYCSSHESDTEQSPIASNTDPDLEPNQVDFETDGTFDPPLTSSVDPPGESQPDDDDLVIDTVFSVPPHDGRI